MNQASNQSYIMGIVAAFVALVFTVYGQGWGYLVAAFVLLLFASLCLVYSMWLLEGHHNEPHA